MEETLALARRLHAGHEDLPLVLRMIENTGVAKRHFVQPITRTLAHPGFEARNRVYIREARLRVPAVVERALSAAGLRAPDIDAIMIASCTGFTTRSSSAHM